MSGEKTTRGKRFQRPSRKVTIIAIIGAVLLVVLIGVVVWQLSGKKDEATSSHSAAKELSKRDIKDECEKKNDKDLCRLLVTWTENKSYHITATTAGGDTYSYDVNGKDNYLKVTGRTAYEVITVDGALYTKAGDTWYKRTLKDGEGLGNSATPLKEGFADDARKYVLIGKEACGDLTCFKYESNVDGTKETIWFDDKDYKARRTMTEMDSAKTEAVFSYDAIVIKAPSPSKDLAADEYIMPGASAPTKLPSSATAQQ